MSSFPRFPGGFTFNESPFGNTVEDVTAGIISVIAALAALQAARAVPPSQLTGGQIGTVPPASTTSTFGGITTQTVLLLAGVALLAVALVLLLRK